MAENATTSTTQDRSHEYFETGPNHILSQVPGLDQSDFPKEFQDTWDRDHVRLPCSDRIYATDVSNWPEIVKALTEPIASSQQLSEAMLQWNKSKSVGWNIHALDAFLNSRANELERQQEEGMHSDGVDLDPEEQLQQDAALESDNYGSEYDIPKPVTEKKPITTEHSKKPQNPRFQEGDQLRQMQPVTEAGGTGFSMGARIGEGGPLVSQFLSPKERKYFFDVTLPRMQALALRLPELIKKPIPFLKQQQDAAVTLSQEQIACLLANAFFNTFPCRNAPYRRGRKKKPALKRGSSGADVNQQKQQHEDDEDEDEDHSDEEERPKGKHPKGGSERGGRGGRGGHHTQQGRGGKKGALAALRSKRMLKATGQAALFEFIPNSASSSSSAINRKLSTSVENLTVKDDEDKEKGWVPKMPSINFISMFWNEENRVPCTTTQAAKLRCILHYFDRVTTEMPTGTVTFHRQVLKRPAYLSPDERLSQDAFCFRKVTVDSTHPLEEAPPGALQLDFANKNIGGGTLEKGAVQEEIRFMVCPELIISRLFTQQLEANEAVLIKGAERYSNYIGYAKTFEWFSDHRDPTPRDKLGRRMTEICAIDARPFKSRVSRLDQFEKHFLLREINKAIVGFRVSPINASEWGLAKEAKIDDTTSGSATSALSQSVLTGYRPIASGNWGCGAFGGHLQLKFVLQWIAASICGGFSPEDKRLGDDLLYYTFGMKPLADEIEAFVKVVEAADKVVEPREIQGFREKSLLEYLASTFVHAP
ncbi:hypothetical protein BG011_008594 [Mortierella polycephala]|uniref:poly(ADP-ribose) glycohydrolase n=1 Tax=Mortierella polycephala TaxID=41804 RepID=A0A9P6PPU6_9FUNG|nr:hypothetical protein BG011_008594 [Mortierella polycephala]